MWTRCVFVYSAVQGCNSQRGGDPGDMSPTRFQKAEQDPTTFYYQIMLYIYFKKTKNHTACRHNAYGGVLGPC